MMLELEKIRICYLPGRESTYVRNRVLVNGLRKVGAVVYDCSCKKKSALQRIIGFAKFLYFKRKSDIVFVGFLGQPFVPLVKLFTRKKIIFDTFLSMYQTLAFDRKAIKPSGVIAKIVRLIEKKSCQMSDKCFLDTNQHIDYFVNEYHIDRSKFQRSLLGADDSPIVPKEENIHRETIIHFHGEFQALHGTQYIIKAAKLLPNIQFRMIGGGRELNDCLELTRELSVNNISFIQTVRFDEIPYFISQATICLGIFGETQKTRLVIPFKVYETLAMSKAIITADTPAIKELLTHEKNVYLCEPANPQDLAKAIQTLLNNRMLRDKIAKNGYKIFKEKCSPKAIGTEILKTAKELLKQC